MSPEYFSLITYHTDVGDITFQELMRIPLSTTHRHNYPIFHLWMGINGAPCSNTGYKNNGNDNNNNGLESLPTSSSKTLFDPPPPPSSAAMACFPNNFNLSCFPNNFNPFDRHSQSSYYGIILGQQKRLGVVKYNTSCIYLQNTRMGLITSSILQCFGGGNG